MCAVHDAKSNPCEKNVVSVAAFWRPPCRPTAVTPTLDTNHLHTRVLPAGECGGICGRVGNQLVDALGAADDGHRRALELRAVSDGDHTRARIDQRSLD